MAIYNYLSHATNDEDENQTIKDEIDANEEALCFDDCDKLIEDEFDDKTTINFTLNDISNTSLDEAYNLAFCDLLLYATNDPDKRQIIKDALYEYTEILGETDDMMYEPPEDQNVIFTFGMTYAEYNAEFGRLVNQINP